MVPASQMGKTPKELGKLQVNATFLIYQKKKKFKSALVFSEAVQSIIPKLCAFFFNIAPKAKLIHMSK